VTGWLRLPIPLPPAHHETIASWLHRLAAVHGLSSADLRQHLRTGPQVTDAEQIHDRDDSPPQLAVFAGQSGDAGTGAEGVACLVSRAEVGKARASAGRAAVGPGGGDAVAGEFVPR
jgi:hypothetical protein